jgi:hypothetical protein
MRSAFSRSCLASVAAGSLMALTACGSGGGSSAVIKSDNGEAGKTGPQVMKDASAAMTAAGTVHVKAVGTEGKPAQKLSMDGHLQTEGMSMTMHLASGQEDVISLDKTIYLKGLGSTGPTSGFPAALRKIVANRWVKFGDDSSGGSSNPSFFASNDDDTTTIGGMAKSFSVPEDGVTIDSKVTRSTLNGKPVIIVTESDGSSFVVDATGTPYVLQANKVANSKTANADEDDGFGTITFSDYGKRVTIAAPTDVVDLNSLMEKIPGALLPSGFPTALPSNLPTDFPTEAPPS